MTIEFSGIQIRRNWNGVLEGTLKIKGDYGRSHLKLTEDLCADILAVCADNIVTAAAEIAEHMKSESARIDVISGTPATTEGSNDT